LQINLIDGTYDYSGTLTRFGQRGIRTVGFKTEEGIDADLLGQFFLLVPSAQSPIASFN
jgi:hypothetical protein